MLDALRNLIDDIVDAHTDTEGCRCNDADGVDECVDIHHRQVDASGLDRHRGTEIGNHFDVMAVGTETLGTEIKTEGFLVADKIENREQERCRLTDDRRPCRTCNTPMKDAREQDVKHKIDSRCNADEQKRALRVTHAAQNGGDHIIACGKDKSCTADRQIVHGHLPRFPGNVHDGENPRSQHEDDDGEHYGKHGDEAEQRADDIVHFFMLFGTQCLGNQNLSRIGKAERDHRCEIENQTALRHRRQTCCTDVFADDDHVDGAVQYLQGVGCHKRQGK